MCRGGCAGGMLSVAVVGVWKGAKPKRRRMHVQQASERERQRRRLCGIEEKTVLLKAGLEGSQACVLPCAGTCGCL